MDRALMTPGTLTLDVSPDDALNLRRRLQAREEIRTTAVLPGGAILEDGPDATTYHFHVPGEWSRTEAGDGIRLEHAAGHVLTVRDGRVQLQIAK
jgi:hypothetical protein